MGAPSWYPRRNGWALPDRPDKSYDTEIRDEFHQSRLPYEAYAYARYDSKKQSAYSIRMPSNSQFTGVDRLKLIKSIMEADAKKKGAQLNIEELVVKLQGKRVNFLQRKIVADEPDERKEDSDDEESDDEVRHPLIVHDRDPEQNLEALRDPSRYRQNLA